MVVVGGAGGGVCVCGGGPLMERGKDSSQLCSGRYQGCWRRSRSHHISAGQKGGWGGGQVAEG